MKYVVTYWVPPRAERVEIDSILRFRDLVQEVEKERSADGLVTFRRASGAEIAVPAKYVYAVEEAPGAQGA